MSPEFQDILAQIRSWTVFMDSFGLPFDIHRIRNDARTVARSAQNLENLVYTDAGGVKSEWCTHHDADPSRRILYLHGGGFIAGGIINHRKFAYLLSRLTGASVLLIAYGLAPEHPFPGAIDDAVSAYSWMRNHGPGGPSEASACFVVGDSAGGNIATALVQSCCFLKQPLPHAVVLMSPFVDLTLTAPSISELKDTDPVLTLDFLTRCRDAYLQDTLPDEALASPLFGPVNFFPPVLIQVGECELLRDDSIRLAEKMKAGGVDVIFELWPDMIHSWQSYYPVFPEAVDAVEQIGRFIRRF